MQSSVFRIVPADGCYTVHADVEPGHYYTVHADVEPGHYTVHADVEPGH